MESREKVRMRFQKQKRKENLAADAWSFLAFKGYMVVNTHWLYKIATWGLKFWKAEDFIHLILEMWHVRFWQIYSGGNYMSIFRLLPQTTQVIWVKIDSILQRTESVWLSSFPDSRLFRLLCTGNAFETTSERICVRDFSAHNRNSKYLKLYAIIGEIYWHIYRYKSQTRDQV